VRIIEITAAAGGAALGTNQTCPTTQPRIVWLFSRAFNVHPTAVKLKLVQYDMPTQAPNN